MKRLVAVLLAALLATFATTAPAAAAGELGISSDGVTYTPTFHGPLFSSAIRWVPGDSRTATFYVRNQSTDDASLTVTLLGDHTGTLFDSGDITISATGGGGSSTPTSSDDEQLLLAAAIGGGNVVPVDVTVAFNENSPNATQYLTTDMNFRVTLTQTTSTGNGGDGSGPLPDTGAPQLIWIVAFISILLGSGVAIVSRHRETHQGESHV